MNAQVRNSPMFVIQCPLNSGFAEHLGELVSYGAQEFYFGYISDAGDALSTLSLRPGPHANFPSLSAACDMVREIADRGCKSFVTLNVMSLPEHAFSAILHDIHTLVQAGCTGFIVTDMNLFLRLRQENSHIYLAASSGAHVMNSRAARFMQSLGARRIILPRQLGTHEIRSIVHACPDLDFEIFIKNEECAFLDGYCSYSHQFGAMDDQPACNELFKMDSPLAPGRMSKQGSCGACALYGLKDLPRLALKICGRGQQYDLISRDVLFLKKVITSLDGAVAAGDFQQFCIQSFEDIFQHPCGERCYYAGCGAPEAGDS